MTVSLHYMRQLTGFRKFVSNKTKNGFCKPLRLHFGAGDDEPSFDKLLIICEVYGITPNDILLEDLSK